MSQFAEYLEECDACTVGRDTRSMLCPICMTQRVMKGKWKIAIIWILKGKTMRFSELKRSLPNVTQAYLSKQLKSLEEDKLIIRKSYNQVPPKVEYSLTETGEKFTEVLDYMNLWGMDYIQEHIIPIYAEIKNPVE